MTPSAAFAAYWYLHVPSLLLVALIYLLGLRALIAVVAGWQPAGVPARVLQRATDPVLAIVAAITPRAVPRMGVLVFAVVWLFALLFAIVFALAVLGVRPLWT